MEPHLIYFAPGGAPLPGQTASVGLPGALAGQADWGFVAVLPRELGEDCVGQIGAAIAGNGARRGLFLLAPWMAPPVSGYRDDGCVRWFALSRAAAVYAPRIRPGDPAAIYPLASGYTRDLTISAGLGVIQFGRPEDGAAQCQSAGGGVIAVIPHRGRRAHLKVAAASLRGQRARADVRVVIGLDQPGGHEEAELMRDPRVRVFEAEPAGVGHFAIRQALIERAETEFIALQDSDDLSCTNRIEVCRAAMLAHGSPDILGCHEIRLDEIEKTVTLRRYPLDVNRALASDGRGGILHGTMFARRSVFAETGGFSTALKYAADTQFKLRAALLLRIGNVDEFLYIRRVHAGSLTSRPETRLGSPARERLRASWERDFRRVRSGLLALGESTLRPQRRERAIVLRELGCLSDARSHDAKPQESSATLFFAAAAETR